VRTLDYNHDESLIDEQWHNLVGTFNGEKLSLYFDGELVATRELTEYTNMYITDEPLIIARGHQDFYFLDGQLDEIRIYDRELTESEVLAIAKH